MTSEPELSAELKACPFQCGQAMRYGGIPQAIPYLQSQTFQLHCSCGAVGPTASMPSEAIAAWNRRSSPQPVQPGEEGAREAAARIIDPDAFVTMRQLAARQGLDASKAPPNVIFAEGIDELVGNRQDRREAALGKADAIFALAAPSLADTPGSDKGERGWERLARDAIASLKIAVSPFQPLGSRDKALAVIDRLSASPPPTPGREGDMAGSDQPDRGEGAGSEKGGA